MLHTRLMSRLLTIELILTFFHILIRGGVEGEYFALLRHLPHFSRLLVGQRPCAVPSSTRRCAQTGRPGWRKPALASEVCGPAPIIWLISLYIIGNCLYIRALIK